MIEQLTRKIKVRWTAQYDTTIDVPVDASPDDCADYFSDIDCEHGIGSEYVTNSFDIVTFREVNEDEH